MDRGCRQRERDIGMLINGVADAKETVRAKEHLTLCERCRKQVAQSQSMGEILSATPEMTFMPQEEVSRMVAAGLQSGETVTGKRKSPETIFGLFPHIAWRAAAAVVVVIGLAIIPWKHHVDRAEHRTATLRESPNERVISSVFRDSSLALGPACSALLEHGSRIDIERKEKTVVVMRLVEGAVFIVGQRGLYDTISVTCGDFCVFATGTRFGVSHSQNGTEVAVLDGSVRVSGAGMTESIVSAFQKWTSGETGTDCGIRDQTDQEQHLLVSAFAELSASETEKTPGNDPLRRVETVHRNGRMTENHYVAAKAMLDRGLYQNARLMLKEYLSRSVINADSAWFDLGYCATILRHYQEAVSAYRKSAALSRNADLVECATHRANKILYLKLNNTLETRYGIKQYLETYPEGRWRDDELYYYIKLAMAEGIMDLADSLLRVYSSEFPRSCRLQELSGKR